MAENDRKPNGLKKLALLAPIVLAGLALFVFWRDLFPSKLSTSATELKLEAFQKEFVEYKNSHDRWAETQIELFRGDITDLKAEVTALRLDIKELRAELREKK